jgi:cytochrome c-type biogenesis protein CcmH/NrfF
MINSTNWIIWAVPLIIVVIGLIVIAVRSTNRNTSYDEPDMTEQSIDKVYYRTPRHPAEVKRDLEKRRRY